jgi:hypothetical protein
MLGNGTQTPSVAITSRGTIMVFGIVTPYRLIGGYQVSEEYTDSIIGFEVIH